MTNSLTTLLFEMYNPGFKMEDFMSVSTHLPTDRYSCKGCGSTFNTAEEFSNHFEREGFNITGCKGTTPTLPFEGRKATRLEV